MELIISTTISQKLLSRTSLCPLPSNRSINGYKFGRGFCRRRLKCNPKPLGVKLGVNRDFSPNSNRESCEHVWEDSQFVEVIGIGSRKDAVLDFCLGSPSVSPCLRFWNILVKETVEVQLEQRLLGEDITPRIVEAPLTLQSCSKAIILVAGAAYGSDYTSVLDILQTIKLANGLVVCIILKPFSFEGRRRQDEVKDLVAKLQALTNFCIMVDGDALLEKDLVTLDEALTTANNAVLMASNAISILISELHTKFLDLPHDSMKELKVSEFKKILGKYKQAKIGFGAGYNVKTSIVRAVYDCPFLGPGVKDLDGIVVFILASSAVIDSSDLNAILRTFRQVTECKGEIVTSVVLEPNLDPNLIVTTVITLGYSRYEPSQKSGIFSTLVKHFPFIFNILRKPHLQSDNSQENCSPELIKSTSFGEMPNVIPMNGTDEVFDNDSLDLQSTLSNNTGEINSLRNYGSTEQSGFEFQEDTFRNEISGGPPTLQRDLLIGHNRGSGYQFAEELASETSKTGATPVLDNLSAYKLPVGVKPSGDLKDGLNHSSTIYHSEIIDDCKMPQFSMNTSLDALTDVSFDALTHLDDNTSALLNGVYPDTSTKNGALSARAASMLEAERDSQKNWSPVVEINYRGGIYLGRCQGGLPEGKGRLSLSDGNIYDGMWRYGKKSGFGTFFFSNGDVFRGSWRDDVMHGKGWFYFHTGDRWFVNLWKGKANGEGRFYSKNGDIFFGHFKDGWRDGHFLCINVDGSRYLEIWDEGVLVSCKHLESDADTG